MPDTHTHEPETPGSPASVVDLTFAQWALLIPLLVHGRLLNADGDLARHLVIGEHIVGHGPRFRDVFSFTKAGEPFLAYEWGSQVLLHLADRVAGLPGVVVLAAVVIAAALALVVKYVRRGGDPWLAYMTGIGAALLTGPHWIARPHLFTLLGLPILLLLLDRERPSPLRLGLLFLLWANLHPGFLYGLVLLAVILAGRTLELGLAGRLTWKAAGRFAALLAVAVGASLVNPFGWTLHAHTLAHLGNSAVLAATDEFQPLEVTSFYGVLVALALCLVALGLTVQRQRVSLDALGAFLVGLLAAFASRRNGPLLAVAGLPMVVRALTPAVALLPTWFAGRMRGVFKSSDRPGRRATVAVLVVLAVLVLLGGRVGGLTLIPDRFSEERFPAVAVEEAQDAGLSGRLLSEYSWGGFVLRAWPGQLIFVDSMADFFGPDLLYRYSMMRDAGPEWRSLLDEYRISLVLLRPQAPLARRLRNDPGWTLWHEDGTAVLFVRQAAG